MEEKGFVPEELYGKILESVPIPCVDVVVMCGGEFLLGKRVNKPSQGEWSVFGGRVLKNETVKEAMVRKIKTEIGLEVQESDLEFLTYGETIYDNSNIEGVAAHTVNLAFKLECNEKPKIKFDLSEDSEVQWFSKIDKDWNPYVVRVLEAAGFSK